MARKANLFEVAGGATSVTYATTGIAGQPSFHFRDADHDVNAEGTDIRTKKTELGTLVTNRFGCCGGRTVHDRHPGASDGEPGRSDRAEAADPGHHHHHGQHESSWRRLRAKSRTPMSRARRLSTSITCSLVR